MTPENNDDSNAAKPIDPAEWEDMLDKYENSDDPVQCTEAIMKGRLYFHTLNIENKEKKFPKLAKAYCNYFKCFRDCILTDPELANREDLQAEKESLLETFEESVEDFVCLNDALNTYIGLKEPEEMIKARLDGCRKRGEGLYKDISRPVRDLFIDHIKKDAFKDFLKKEFGNVEIIKYWEGKEDYKMACDALKEEDDENPFWDEMIGILEEFLGGTSLPHNEAIATHLNDPTVSESYVFPELDRETEKAIASGNYEEFFEFIAGIEGMPEEFVLPEERDYYSMKKAIDDCYIKLFVRHPLFQKVMQAFEKLKK